MRQLVDVRLRADRALPKRVEEIRRMVRSRVQELALVH
jgi:hypothetical protein